MYLINIIEDDELNLIVSVTVAECVICGIEFNIKWFMDRGESRLKITRDGESKIHLGVEYKWGQDILRECPSILNPN